MNLCLNFINGPFAGKKLVITHSTSLGRTSADIVLNDPKLSGTHVFFDLKDSGWQIRDQNSTNGIWINGHKETHCSIENEDLLTLGSSEIKCLLLKSEFLEFSDKFQKWTQSLTKKIKNLRNDYKEIKPEIQLKVIKGSQYKQFWNIFYAPRYAGKNHSDICLYDEKAPKNAFRIISKNKYPYFFTENKEIVKINNKSLKLQQLQPGDIISFGQSQILVEFEKDHGFYP